MEDEAILQQRVAECCQTCKFLVPVDLREFQSKLPHVLFISSRKFAFNTVDQAKLSVYVFVCVFVVKWQVRCVRTETNCIVTELNVHQYLLGYCRVSDSREKVYRSAFNKTKQRGSDVLPLSLYLPLFTSPSPSSCLHMVKKTRCHPELK
jgi:hypothetical protein